MATVLILIDAMRYDYINSVNTPFLQACSAEGSYIEHIIPSYGFCERTEILSGVPPNKSGYFTAIGYDPKNSPFRNFRGLWFLSAVEKILHLSISKMNVNIGELFSRLYRRVLRSTFLKRNMGIYRIPINLLKYFALTEDGEKNESNGGIKFKSILNLMEEKAVEYYQGSFTSLDMPPNGDDKNRMRLALIAAEKSEAELFLVYITIIDSVGHDYGPESIEMKNALKKIDGELNDFVQECEKISPGNDYIFLGDHGMVTVESHFNAEEEILFIAGKYGMKLGRDYLMFLDSTVVRLWAQNPHASMDDFIYDIEKSEAFQTHGIFVDDEKKKEIELPLDDERYGQVLWIANPGVLVFPDYFHRNTPSKGMHGYDINVVESHGSCIMYGPSHSPKYVENAKLVSLFNVLHDHVFRP
jgi:hypothetical protein